MWGTSAIFLAFAALLSIVNGDKTFPLGQPVCILIQEQITYSGLAEFVDVDNSGVSTQTTGDLSIAANLRAPFSLTTDDFVVNNVAIQAICTVTKDSLNTAPSAPSCNLEIDIDFCPEQTCVIQRLVGKLFATGTGPEAFAITGGSGDFMGAFGQLTTNGSFRVTGAPNENGDLNISFDTTSVQVCVFPNVKVTSTVRISTGGAGDSGVVMTAICGSNSCAVVGNLPGAQSCSVECDVGSTLSITCDTTTEERSVDEFEFTAGAVGCCSTSVTQVPLIEARCTIANT